MGLIKRRHLAHGLKLAQLDSGKPHPPPVRCALIHVHTVLQSSMLKAAFCRHGATVSGATGRQLATELTTLRPGAQASILISHLLAGSCHRCCVRRSE